MNKRKPKRISRTETLLMLDVLTSMNGDDPPEYQLHPDSLRRDLQLAIQTDDRDWLIGLLAQALRQASRQARYIAQDTALCHAAVFKRGRML